MIRPVCRFFGQPWRIKSQSTKNIFSYRTPPHLAIAADAAVVAAATTTVAALAAAPAAVAAAVAAVAAG